MLDLDSGEVLLVKGHIEVGKTVECFILRILEVYVISML